MSWFLLLWSLKISITLLNILASFKALKVTSTRKKRGATIEKEAAGGKVVLTSIERARRRNLKAQLSTWVVWITFCAIERIADKTLFILPLYDELKVMGLLFILAWRSAGAELVFKKVIKPLVSPYERPLDAIGFVINEILNVIIGASLLLPKWAVKQWSREPIDEVPNIMRSLRVPARPALSHQLADSLETAQANQAYQSKPSSNHIDKLLEVPVTHPRRAPATVVASITSTSRLPDSTFTSYTSTNIPKILPRASTAQLSRSTFRAALSTSTSTNNLNRSTRMPSNTNLGLKDESLYRTIPTKSLYPDLSGSVPTPFDQLSYRREESILHPPSRHNIIAPAIHPLRTSTSRSSLRTSSSSSQLPPLPPTLPSADLVPSHSPPPPLNLIQEYHSPSSPPSAIPFILEPPTPAPPGSFQSRPKLSLTTISTSSSSSTNVINSKPLRNPTIDNVASGESTPIPSSPREKAAFAIRSLGKDLESADDRLVLDFSSKKSGIGLGVSGSAKKRGRKISNDSEVEEAEDKKVVKKSRKIVDQLKGKTAAGKGKAKAFQNDDIDAEVSEVDDVDDGSYTAATTSKRTIGVKRSRSNSPAVSKKASSISKPKLIKGKVPSKKITNTDSSSSDIEISVPLPKSKLKVPSSLKPPSLSSSSSANNLSNSLRAKSSLSSSTSRSQLSTSTSRNQLSKSTRNPLSLSTTSSSSSTNSTNSSATIRPTRSLLATSVSRGTLNPNLEGGSSKEREKAPEKKKPRRVLLGVVKNLEGSEGEEDGVPVVRRRRT